MPGGQRGELMATDIFGWCGPLCVASLRVSPELESASAWPQISADRWRAPWESEIDDWAPETFGRDQDPPSEARLTIVG